MMLHRFAIFHDLAPFRHESRLKSLHKFKFLLEGHELHTRRVHEGMLWFSNRLDGLLKLDAVSRWTENNKITVPDMERLLKY